MTSERDKTVRAAFMRALIPVGVLIVLVWVAIAGIYRYLGRPATDHVHIAEGENGNPDPKAIPLTVGSTLPDINLVPFVVGSDSNPAVQLSSLKHKVILINFWATWCEACIAEMPSLVRLRDQFKDQGFEILAVNVDERAQTAIPRWVKRLKISFPIFTDRNQALTTLFDVYAIPLSIVVDQNRKILHVEYGDREWDTKEVTQKMKAWLGAST